MQSGTVQTDDILRTRRQRVEDREAAIIAVARDMFNAQGYPKTTIAAIAKKSGVADGTVYTYFKNKDDLARAVLADFYAELTAHAQDGVDALSRTHERLAFLARHHLQNVIAHWRILEMLSFTDRTFDQYEGSDLYRMNRDYVAVFDRVVKNAMSQGHIDPALAPWIIRDMFFGSMDYAARTILLKNNPGDVDVFVEHILRLIINRAETAYHHAGAKTVPLEAVVDRLSCLVDRLEATEMKTTL